MLRNEVIKIIPRGLHPVAARQGLLQWLAISHAQTCRAIERGIAQQLNAAAQLPPKIEFRICTHGTQHVAQHGITRDEHAAFKRAQALAHGQAEKTHIALERNRHPIAACTQGLRSIFNHIGTHIAGALQRGIHIGHTTTKMRGQHGQRLAAAKQVQAICIHIQRIHPQIAQTQLQPALRNGQCHQWAGVGGCNDFVALWPEPLEAAQSHHQRRGARALELHAVHAQPCGQLLCKITRAPGQQISPLQRQACRRRNRDFAHLSSSALPPQGSRSRPGT